MPGSQPPAVGNRPLSSGSPAWRLLPLLAIGVFVCMADRHRKMSPLSCGKRVGVRAPCVDLGDQKRVSVRLGWEFLDAVKRDLQPVGEDQEVAGELLAAASH